MTSERDSRGRFRKRRIRWWEIEEKAWEAWLFNPPPREWWDQSRWRDRPHP
jgi:hypothetical protein